MVEKKVSRKELLKEPDEFLTASARAILYMSENPGKVIMVAVITVAVVVGALGYNAYSSYRNVTSHELFLQAVRTYEEQLEGDEEPSAEKVDPVLAQFEDIVRQYGSLPAGEMALLYTGHIFFKKKDYKAALERYLKMESSHLAGQGLREVFWYHTAETRMALKEYDQAMTLFDQLSKDNDSPYRREAYASIARIYELTDRKKEAVQAYRQYLKMFPEAPDAAFVKAKIAELSVQG